MKINVDRIIPNPEQPRLTIDDGEIAILADSLRQHGLLNPIAIEGPYDGYYVLLDGERRWRAAKLAEWDSIEAHVIENNGDKPGRLIMALVGNLQRSDMGPVDEAKAYSKLRDEMSVREICERVGRSDGHVYARLGMLEWGLADEVLELINLRRIPSDAKMLRVLCQLPNEIQVPLVRQAARSNCSASRIKGLVTRALRKQPLHCIQRPNKTMQTKPALAPALAACTIDEETLPEKMVPAIVTTCNKCGMGDDRLNNVICRDCPLPNFIQLFWNAKQKSAGDPNA